MAVEPPRVAPGQQVRYQVGRVEVGFGAGAHVAGHRHGRCRHVAFDLLAPRGGLRGLLRDGCGGVRRIRQRFEPLGGQVEHPLLVEVGRDREDGVRGVVVRAVERLHVVERSALDVAGLQSDGCPAVGVHLVGQCPEQHRLVAVGLVEVALPELLDHHAFLRVEFFGCDLQPLHAVALEPEGRLDIVLRQGDVEIRVVVVREGVVVARGHLYGQVEIRDLARPAEHQVFEQVCEPRAGGVLVARPDLVEQVHGGQFRRPVAIDDDRQSVCERLFAVCDHGAKLGKNVWIRIGRPCRAAHFPRIGANGVPKCVGSSAGCRGLPQTLIFNSLILRVFAVIRITDRVLFG